MKKNPVSNKLVGAAFALLLSLKYSELSTHTTVQTIRYHTANDQKSSQHITKLRYQVAKEKEEGKKHLIHNTMLSRVWFTGCILSVSCLKRKLFVNTGQTHVSVHVNWYTDIFQNKQFTILIIYIRF